MGSQSHAVSLQKIRNMFATNRR